MISAERMKDTLLAAACAAKEQAKLCEVVMLPFLRLAVCVMLHKCCVGRRR